MLSAWCIQLYALYRRRGGRQFPVGSGLLLLKCQLPEATRIVGVEGAHRRPCGPVRGRCVVAAFIEVAAPSLSRYGTKGPHVVGEYLERDEKLVHPRCGSRDLRIDSAGHGMVNPDQRCIRLRQRRYVCESCLCPGVVPDVAGMQGSSAVDFEVEVSAVVSWLDEELDATVCTDGTIEHRLHAPDVLILNAKNEV